MDPARSRKRLEKAQRAAERAAAEAASTSRLSKLLDTDENQKPKGKGKERPPRKEKKPFDPSDKSQYRPKAIRSAHALIYSQEKFDLPPASERLAGVTRVDLEGSGCTDVSWLKDTAVTWLSLKGCPVTEGWDAVGGLEGLAVLNISSCDLTTLPKELKGLKNLKAIVAMNNEWSEIDADVVSGWEQLNSMIVSHSPNLTSLPSTLATLPHLAKITISHCAKLTAAGLPDLTPLPLLRDLRANNLPRLSSLPAHIATWGTGNLALVGKGKDDEERKGDGLEVVDFGNCSLPLSAISSLFALSLPPGGKPKHVWKLRSITLQANPLTLEEEKYAELLQASPALPRLQIIDSKRVVERKKAGMVPESKAEKKARERREKKMGPTGANVSSGKMRSWGAGEDGDKGDKKEKTEKKDKKERKEKGERGEKPKLEDRKRKHRDDDETPKPRKKAADETLKADKPKKRKERYFEVSDDETAEPPAKAKPTKPVKAAPAPAPAAAAAAPAPADAEADQPSKKRKRKHGKSNKPEDAAAPAPTAAPAAASAPARLAAAAPAATPAKPDPKANKASSKPKKPTKSETAVVGVVEVAKPKAGGVDLKSVFSKESDSGLGVGGW